MLLIYQIKNLFSSSLQICFGIISCICVSVHLSCVHLFDVSLVCYSTSRYCCDERLKLADIFDIVTPTPAAAISRLQIEINEGTNYLPLLEQNPNLP